MFETIHELPTELISSSFDYLPMVILSYVLFMVIYIIVSPTIGNLTSKTYSNLKQSHKIEWNNRFTSTVFSSIVSIISLYILFVDHAIESSPLIYSSMLVKANIAIVMGYTISDMSIIIYNYRIIGDVFTLLHHSFAFVGYGYSLTYSVMPYFANFRLICELSTPLVNMRWFLYAGGHNKNSMYFFVNGLVMTLMFFVVRIAIIPVYWYKVYSISESHLWAQMRHLRYIMIVTCVILDVINLFWFRKMFSGARKILATNCHQYFKHQNSQKLNTAYSNSLKNELHNADTILSSMTRQSHNLNGSEKSD